ncbi:MAG: serine/threonine-protein kinase [Thermoanaerobaculia bacterium]|nr:serine/threonine-protein kinase [Thermoanaerobaculia bacterium]
MADPEDPKDFNESPPVEDPGSRSARLLDLLGGALDQPVDRRADFLAEACGDDESLQEEVLVILTSESRSGFLETPALEIAQSDLSRRLDVAAEGVELGPYRLLHVIGFGGMSRVYLAERSDGAFDQQVAVKLLRPLSGDVDEARARFEAERQILATLSHPNIASLIDGGFTAEGQPYLVMEYLPGLSLIDHCQQHGLSLGMRLDLFRDACDAVAHAHRHLIVHRDLKPSNILVTEDGHLKLLDFGIAKLLSSSEESGIPGREVAPHTRTGLLLMTPDYGAPEQVRGEAISTATDVHGLGLVLFELLTDQRLFDLAGRLPSEIEKTVCEQPVERPSTRVARDGRDDRDLRGDLDAIVLKALRKEPAERYSSVGALSEDLDRYRRGFAVQARLPTLRYRMSKAVRRNSGWFAAATVIVLLILGALIAVTLEQRKTAQQRDLAQFEAGKARRLADFTLGLFDAANPESGDDVTVRQLLRGGVEQLSGMDEDPLIKGELLSVMGAALLRLGDLDQAEVAYRAELDLRREHQGDRAPEIATALVGLGGTLSLQDRREEALELLLEAIQLDDQLFPEKDRIETVWHLRELSRQYLRLGDLENGRIHAQRGHDMVGRLGDGFVKETASFLDLLAFVATEQGEFAKAREWYEEAQDLRIRGLDEHHPDMPSGFHNLGYVSLQLEDWEAAERYYRSAVDLRRQTSPDNPGSLGSSLGGLGAALLNLNRLDEAEVVLVEACEVLSEIKENHSGLVSPMLYLGQVRRARGDLVGAEEQLLEALNMARLTRGSDHGPRQSRISRELGSLYEYQNRFDDAASAYRDELAGWESVGSDDPRVLDALNRLAALLEKTGNGAEAEQLRERAARLETTASTDE